MNSIWVSPYFWLEAWLRPQVEAGAEVILWQYANENTVRGFLRSEAISLALKARFDCSAKEVAATAEELLEETLCTHKERYHATFTKMVAAATVALPRGILEATRAAAQIARTASAPPTFIGEAVDRAAQNLTSLRQTGAARAVRRRY